MPEVIRLWPDGPPTTIDGVPPEVEYVVKRGVEKGLTFYSNISDATLTVFEPAAGTGNGVGVIVAPGGGWTINAWGHEGGSVAEWLNGLGYTAFVLKYRVMASGTDQEAFEARWEAQAEANSGVIPYSKKPKYIGDAFATEAYLQARAACADDGRRAIEVVRKDAARFGVRPESVGMLGFSAGAFLIVDIALDPRAEQVAFIAPIYGGETRGESVPDDAPPLFTAVAQDDILVRIVDGLYADWKAADRPAELHGYRRGQHGFGTRKQGLPSDGWMEQCAAWLADLMRDR